MARSLMDEATDATLERLGNLMQQYAAMCQRTNTEVAHALLASKTLAKHGYTHEQRGHLTEQQAHAGVLLLDHWIARKHEQREHQRQPDARP